MSRCMRVCVLCVLQDGYQTDVGEKSALLSGGQKQVRTVNGGGFRFGARWRRIWREMALVVLRLAFFFFCDYVYPMIADVIAFYSYSSIIVKCIFMCRRFFLPGWAFFCFVIKHGRDLVIGQRLLLIVMRTIKWNVCVCFCICSLVSNHTRMRHIWALHTSAVFGVCVKGFSRIVWHALRCTRMHHLELYIAQYLTRGKSHGYKALFVSYPSSENERVLLLFFFFVCLGILVVWKIYTATIILCWSNALSYNIIMCCFQ